MTPRLPYATLLLIAANLFAAFLLLFEPGLAVDLGYRPDAPSVGSAFTGLFLHANLAHLLGNMVFLAAAGAAVELAAGTGRFATVYFVGGLAGVALHTLIVGRSPDPAVLIGASGCIAGCVGYYGFRYPGLAVELAPKVRLSVRHMALLWVALQVLGAFIRVGDSGSGGTAYWAHLGGLAAGFLLSRLYRAPDLAQVRRNEEVLLESGKRGPAAMETAARLHLERHPHDPVGLRQLAEALALQGDVAGESAALVELLEVAPPSEQPSVLIRLCEVGQATLLPSLRRTMLADRFAGDDPACAAALLQSVVDGPNEDPQRPEAMLALASLERERHPGRAEALLAALARDYPLHPTVDLARQRGWLL